ncbi:unnamed protein product [Lactuca saligna]|uniref:EH domain-containing protein n=1 Tax=Lactuca saligna TaxID=75948 RepID=A0AA35YWZ4_LACSI|nr:unnamed protein product [Lactuca saligna]
MLLLSAAARGRSSGLLSCSSLSPTDYTQGGDSTSPMEQGRGTDYKCPYFFVKPNDASVDEPMSSSTKSEVNGVQTRTTTEPEPPLIQGVGSRTRVRFQLPGEKQLMEESDQLLQVKIFKEKRILQGYMVGIKLDWRGNANGGPIEWGNTLIQSKLVPVVCGISVVTTSMELYLPQWATMRLVDLSLMVNKLSGPFPRVLSRITTLVPLTAVTSIIDGLKKLYIQKLKPLEVTYWGPDSDPPNPIFFYPIISQHVATEGTTLVKQEEDAASNKKAEKRLHVDPATWTIMIFRAC